MQQYRGAYRIPGIQVYRIKANWSYASPRGAVVESGRRNSVKRQSIFGFVFLVFTACGAPDTSGSDEKEGTIQALSSDTTPPVSTVFIEQTPDANGNYHNNVSILITATDNSAGVESIHWSLSGAQTGSGTGAGSSVYVPVITNMGTTTLTYYAKDLANNYEAARSVTITNTPV
jgi:hypothetical protein